MKLYFFIIQVYVIYAFLRDLLHKPMFKGLYRPKASETVRISLKSEGFRSPEKHCCIRNIVKVGGTILRHIADIKMVEQLVEGLQAKIHVDRGYISQELKSRLKDQAIDLITYHRKNMKSVQLPASDEYHLKQRNKIETLFSLLKGQYNLVTSKARSIAGFLSVIYASLCAYQLSHRRKPTIQIMESLA